MLSIKEEHVAPWKGFNYTCNFVPILFIYLKELHFYANTLVIIPNSVARVPRIWHVTANSIKSQWWWCGCQCRLGWFEYFRLLLISWDFHTQDRMLWKTKNIQWAEVQWTVCSREVSSPGSQEQDTEGTVGIVCRFSGSDLCKKI